LSPPDTQIPAEPVENAEQRAPAPLHLSVGELVDFACRCGDLVSDSAPGPSAQEGIRAHQKLQKKRPKTSEAEYRLQVEYEWLGQPVQLNGRVDILHPRCDLHHPVQLDEIKTTYCSPDNLNPSLRALHWAQLKIYGFCYLLQHGTACLVDDRIALQMLWHNLKDKKTYPELREFAWPELEAFAREALGIYIRWRRQWQQHRQRLRASAKALPFPFPEYRAGQRYLSVAAYRCLRDGGELVVEAPTGIGKTISTLFPAVKAVGEEQIDQVVYLTAKNSGRAVVRESISRLQQNGLKLSLLEIQARDRTCACSLGLCSKDAEGICPRTRGFYDRLPDARQQLLGTPLLTPDAIAEVADKLRLCPFELSLQMLPWADLVVCDFNYVFDPLVRLNVLLDQGQRRALLIDEAHNLGDRARGMYSASLSRKESRRSAAECKDSHPALRRSIQSLVRAVDQWVSRCRQDRKLAATRSEPGSEHWVLPNSEPEAYPTAVSRAAEKVATTISLLSEQSKSAPDAIGEWLKNLYRYLCIEQLQADQHRCITRTENPGAPWEEQQIKLLCLNPASYLAQCFRQFHGLIAFSATLRPAGYFYQQLGFRSETPYLQLPSPFDSEQLGVFLCPFIDTRYRARQHAFSALCDLIGRVYCSRPGNYLVFFPSYQFMQQVAEKFTEFFPDIALLQQRPNASENERAAFLHRFNEGQRTLGFAIMGGIFGEGVDYVGERLVGTIVVGIGLPQVNLEQELLRAGCENTLPGNDSGFDAAYRYPGMTRVLQTAGRVIRTESDRGVLILADDRFMDPFYYNLFPEHWRPHVCRDGNALSTALHNFWGNQ